MVILISGKVDLSAKKITRDRKRHYIIIKESMHQEYITIRNVYAPKQKNCKIRKAKADRNEGEIDKFTILVVDFNTTLSPINNRTTRQKTIKSIELKTTINP